MTLKKNIMTITIKKKTSKKELDHLLLQLKKKANVKKKSLLSVFGIFKFNEDAVTIQKKLRNEWD
jgi:nanoRNase/pAp phosphatase (c-di-AMP/oligoRNAs hydrolase)